MVRRCRTRARRFSPFPANPSTEIDKPRGMAYTKLVIVPSRRGGQIKAEDAVMEGKRAMPGQWKTLLRRSGCLPG